MNDNNSIDIDDSNAEQGLNNDKVDNNQQGTIEKKDEESPGKKAAIDVAHHKQLMIKILKQLDDPIDRANIRLTCKQFYALSFLMETQTQLTYEEPYFPFSYHMTFQGKYLLDFYQNCLIIHNYPNPGNCVIKFLFDNKKKIEYMISSVQSLHMKDVQPKILKFFEAVDYFKNVKKFIWSGSDYSFKIFEIFLYCKSLKPKEMILCNLELDNYLGGSFDFFNSDYSIPKSVKFLTLDCDAFFFERILFLLRDFKDNEIDELNIDERIYKQNGDKDFRKYLLLITKYFKLVNYSMSSVFIGYDNEGFKKSFGVNGMLCDTPMHISYNLSLKRYRRFDQHTSEGLNSEYIKLKGEDKDLDLKIETLYTKVRLLSMLTYFGDNPIGLMSEINVRCLSNDISKMINLECLEMSFLLVGSEIFKTFINSLPKRLKHLRLTDCNKLAYYHLCKISRICPLIETLSLTDVGMEEITIRRIILQFRNLRMLKVSFGERYRIRDIIDSIVTRDGTIRKGMIRWPRIDGVYISCKEPEERDTEVLEKMAEITPRGSGQFIFGNHRDKRNGLNFRIIVQRKLCDYDQRKIVFY
uniref:F-box domain-containing protein n=1 Tax=Parastrongyloides trichosuri TaxID=131310 RepID=A0A0N5A2Y4_PARTI